MRTKHRTLRIKLITWNFSHNDKQRLSNPIHDIDIYNKQIAQI